MNGDYYKICMTNVCKNTSKTRFDIVFVFVWHNTLLIVQN